MSSDSEQGWSIPTGLPTLAGQCLSLLESGCPSDWRRLLPTLDLQKPDRDLPPKALPVLSFLPRLLELAPPRHRALVAQLIAAQASLHFNQTYAAGDFGADFLQQYGWMKFLGPDAYWHSDVLSSGLVLLGDRITYPEHWHVAEELYFPLSGTAEWYHEEQGWRSIAPGAMIYHASNIRHSMRTAGEPLLTLYLWRGGDLLQKSNINR